MKYKAVLFDMDGTVLDTLGDLAAAVNHTLREFSMPERSIAEVAAALGNGRGLSHRAHCPRRDTQGADGQGARGLRARTMTLTAIF